MTSSPMGRLNQTPTNPYANGETLKSSSGPIQNLVDEAQQNGDRSEDDPVQSPLEQLDASGPLDKALKAIQQQVVMITGVMKQSSDLESLFQVTVTQIQGLLKADRVLLYQFTTHEEGVVVAESVVSGWTPTLSETLPALCFGLGHSSQYGRPQKAAIEDVETSGLSPYQRQLFEKFQVKSSLALPIVFDQEIRGLLVVQQCDKPRRWSAAPVSVLAQVINELVAHLQTHELRSQLQKQVDREQILAKMTARMLEPQSEDAIFRFASREIRRILNADRVMVYRFDPDSGYNIGTVVAEDVLPAYTSALQAQVQDHSFGKHAQKYQEGYHWAAADIYAEEVSECHVAILERFQVRANLITPLLKGDDLWGLLCVNQCDGPRYWQDFEIEFVKRVAAQLSATRQQAEYTDLLKKRAEQESILAKMVTRMIEPQSEDVIFQFATRETRRFLNADRVVVYRFDPDSGYDVGTVVAEDVLPAYKSALQAQIKDHSFGKHVEKYREGYHWAAADIHDDELPDCHVAILERFQVRANLVTPLLKGDTLWGLFCVNQCDGPRPWQDFEIEFTKRVAAQLSAASQQAEYTDLLGKRAERESILAKITAQMIESQDEQVIFQFATREIRRLFNADRVGVFCFDPDSGCNQGMFVAEDVLPTFPSALQAQIEDHCFGKNTAKYREGYHWAATDIYELELSECHIAILERFQVRANLVAPLLKGDELWGLLCVHQCDGPRPWQDFEIEFVKRVAAQLSATRQQAEYTDLLKQRAERESILTKITAQMIESQDEQVIFQFAAREIRRLFNTDRVGVFRFDPDSGCNQGMFVAEDVLPTFPSALQAQIEDHCFGKNTAKYREGYHWAATDIYELELSECHIAILERFRVRANLVAPLLKGDELWGLLCVHQCDSPRRWQDFEIEFVKRVAAQLSATRQQAEYTDLLEQRAYRERILTKIATRTLQAEDEQSIFSFATRELRLLLQADRVMVFQFDPKSNHARGRVVAEDALPEFSSALAAQVEDRCFGKHTEKYRQGGYWAVRDIYGLDLPDCHIAILERFQVRANLVVPLLKGPDLWGLLCIHQCSGPRQWRDFEIEFVKRAAISLSVAREKTEYIKQLTKSVRLEQLVVKVVARIRQSDDIETIFNSTLSAVRSALQAEHIAIYKFRPDFFGDFVAESEAPGFPKFVGSGWEDTYVQEHQGGRLLERQPYVVDDIYTAELSDCHIETLEYFGVKSFALVAVFKGTKLWGILTVMKHSGPRHWLEEEVNLLNQIADQLGLALQQFEYTDQLAKIAAREQAVSKIIGRIRQTLDIDAIFSTVTQDMRQLLQCDRVGIYRFNPDWSGEFVAESVTDEWSPLLQLQTEHPRLRENISDCSAKELVKGGSRSVDTYLQKTQGGRYSRGELFRVADNIYESGFSNCYIDILEQYQAKAYIIVAIYKERQLWGLLAAYQNSGPRQWESAEINTLVQVGGQLGTALQQAEYTQQLAKQAERERAIAKVATRIRQTLDLKAIFTAITQEVRQVLGVERTTIYKFRPDFFGDFVAESGAKDLPKLVGSGWEDPYLQEHQGGRFSKNEPLVVDNVYTGDLTDCHIEALEHYGVKSCLVTPIFQGQTLWGLLSAFQNSGPRHWEEEEVSLLMQISSQLGTALQQAEYTQQLAKSAEREQAASKIISKIRQTLDINTVFTTTTEEMRRLLQCDRVGIYRFNPDWSGEFVAESLTSGWRPLLQVQAENPRLQENISECSAKELEKGSAQSLDTYLQQTQGGRYSKGELFRVANNIYESGFSDCYIEILEQFQAKAYVIVAIYKGRELWGLLAAYQNSGPRQWESAEISTLVQIGAQLGVAIQQAESLATVQSRNEELARLAEREQNFLRIIDKVGQSIVDKIRLSQGIETIFDATLYQLRQLLQADRTLIYRFNPDWSGDYMAESVAQGWNRLVGPGSIPAIRTDTHLQRTEGGRYRNHETHVLEDIYKANLDACHIDLLEQYEARSYVIAPIFAGETLWGLLAAYQNSGPRQWDPQEVNLLVQIGSLLGVALRQSDYLEQLQSRTQQVAEAAEREKTAKQTLQTNVLELLTAVRPALEGDLTVRAPVTEDEVGTVADAYNSTLRVLRKIVTQVQAAANQVGQTSQSSSSAVIELSQRAQQEVQELTQALQQVQTMVKATEAVANSAQQVDQAVHQANQVMHLGDAAMDRTVGGIQAIRTTVSETSKKIKRLSESSQKISKVVNLINDFTDQTQLLALNAAIEATRAGDYGRGFAVVADEIRSLAQRSTEATTDIEKLIEEIQSETTVVASAMDADIEQVVKATNLVGETRQSLNAMMTITGKISQLVQNITQSTQAQTQQSQSVTETMTNVVAIANQSSDKSAQMTSFFQELLATAEELQATVGKFTVN